jgi:deoxyribose-phosphate aldolase
MHNIKKIKSLAKQYDMVLDLDRIKRQDNEELERIIQMIERTYANR